MTLSFIRNEEEEDAHYYGKKAFTHLAKVGNWFLSYRYGNCIKPVTQLLYILKKGLAVALILCIIKQRRAIPIRYDA